MRRIEHVVVLMLENRSFDNVLGFLDHPDPRFPRPVDADGRPLTNPVNPADPQSRHVAVTADGDHLVRLDPPHSHKSAMEQLGAPGIGAPRMDGFIAAYARKAMGLEERPIVHWWRIGGVAIAASAVVLGLLARVVQPLRRFWLAVEAVVAAAISFALWRAKRSVDTPPVVEGVGEQIMQCLAPDKLPVLAELARSFAVCTRWHCSVPGETWPNRNFIHAATSDGTVDIEIGLYDTRTVFELLEEHGHRWHVYHDGRAHLWAFERLWDDDRIGNWYEMAAFHEHVAAGWLPAYSFVEPRHHGVGSNSQHPGNNTASTHSGSDFARGEQLIASIYESLRANPALFEKTLFLVTYDEHGGFYDHVPPPRGVASPDPIRRLPTWSRRLVAWFVERKSTRFGFRLLGPRVPAIVISPWVERATLDHRVYDHTSVIATLRALFAPTSSPLTPRDAEAQTFEHLVSGRATPRVADLPDLSIAAQPPQIRLAADATAEVVAAAVPTDDFAADLAAVAGCVRRELGGFNPLQVATDLLSAITAVLCPDADAAVAFDRRAEARRSESKHLDEQG